MTYCKSFALFILCSYIQLLYSEELSSLEGDFERGILFPQDSESRQLKSLDGLWNFRIAPKNSPMKGFVEEWFTKPLEQTGSVESMPVPSSYNDVTQSKVIRDHVGWAWYDRTFWIPRDWINRHRIFLRFGGVNYEAIVWVNGNKVLEHSGGHLPFAVELTSMSTTLVVNSTNRITVAIDNVLRDDTIPQGTIHRTNDKRYPDYVTLNYAFDYFNYAGIHRPVYLYTTPVTYIDDITVVTTASEGTGFVDYSIRAYTSATKLCCTLVKPKSVKVTVTLEDKSRNVVATGEEEQGQLIVPHAKLWWPLTSVKNDSDAGFLYTLVVTLTENESRSKDVYRLKVGLRSVTWTNQSFLINEKPFYFRGFGRHEDYDIRGKGVDNVMIVKDYNLVKWIGANSYRTSHYPYAEEIMDVADALGIVIIDECPAVSLTQFGPNLLENHKKSIREMIQRDKNRPSVVMWSLGNEPESQEPAAENYFSEVVTLARTLDSTRPITVVMAQAPYRQVPAKFLDIICINRYSGWYSDTGHPEVIRNTLVREVKSWVRKFHRPVMLAEYGADSIAGMHNNPEVVFSEEYQLTVMREHFKAFDFLRQKTSFIGEHIWNFADFMTRQELGRIGGNRKGIFTRQRQPKASAHYLRIRYHLLAKELNGYPIPADLNHEFPVYTIPNLKVRNQSPSFVPKKSNETFNNQQNEKL